ncbi:MAG: hypothetical protein ACI30H_08960 [Paludibacteraceae bacterium]
MITLNLDESAMIADVLKTKLSVLQNRLEHYQSMLEVGKSTTRQQDLYWDAKNTLETVQRFIQQVEDEKYYENFRAAVRREMMKKD